MAEDLAAHARRIAHQADKASAAFGRSLARVWREAERRYRTLLTAAPESPSALVRAVQAAALRTSMRTALRDAGYDALVEAATDAPLDRLASTLIAQRPDLAALVGPVQLEALKTLHRLDLIDEGDAVARRLWDAVARGLYARAPVTAILADLATIIDRTDAQIATLYDTSVSIYTRQVELMGAGDDPGMRFRYVGPDDDLTRPFCEARVNRVFTRAEIDAMENGQLDNVFLTGGGYNCRHLWMRLSDADE